MALMFSAAMEVEATGEVEATAEAEPVMAEVVRVAAHSQTHALRPCHYARNDTWQC